MAKLGFVTCVQLGLSCMAALYESGGTLDLAITLNDDQAKQKSGRVYLDDFCQQHNIPLVKSSHVNNQDVMQAIQEADLDWLFIIGWSQIASLELLQTPKQGVLGMHPTLLPQGRGRAAIPWAIIKGLEKTGVTLFKLDEGVDTGPILAQLEIPLHDKIDATDLYQQVDEAHVNLMKQVIQDIYTDKVQLQEQDDSLATEWPGRKPEDGEINLQGSVQDAEKLVRALTSPYPGAFFYQDTQKTIIHKATVVTAKPDAVQSNSYLEFKDGYLLLEKIEELL